MSLVNESINYGAKATHSHQNSIHHRERSQDNGYKKMKENQRVNGSTGSSSREYEVSLGNYNTVNGSHQKGQKSEI